MIRFEHLARLVAVDGDRDPDRPLGDDLRRWDRSTTRILAEFADWLDRDGAWERFLAEKKGS